jgi:hypothetical protein
MLVTVTTEFPGRPDNEALARRIKVGEVISGELAAVALAEGWASEEGREDVIAPKPAEYGSMTRGALDALAAERGVDITASKNKADVIAALEAADAAAAATD